MTVPIRVRTRPGSANGRRIDLVVPVSCSSRHGEVESTRVDTGWLATAPIPENGEDFSLIDGVQRSSLQSTENLLRVLMLNVAVAFAPCRLSSRRIT